MSSIKLVLMKHKAKHPEETPIYLRITKDRRSSYISLGYYTDEKHWDLKRCRVTSSHPNSSLLNARLSDVVTIAERALLLAEEKKEPFSDKDIKEFLTKGTDVTFSDYARAKRDTLLEQQNYSRYKKVKGILSKMDEYTSNQNLLFSNITPQFLKKYSTWMRDVKENKVNTIHSNLKYIKQVFKEAIKEGLIEAGSSPFDRFELTTERSTRDYLSEKELKRIEDLVVKPESIARCRDMFVFACYTGLRISDLLTLKVVDFDGEHITIQMRKTNETLSIKVPTLGCQIIAKYSQNKKDQDYLFPFISSQVEYSKLQLQKQIMSKTALCNKYLKDIASNAGLSKNVTFHVSRHTFATRALRKGVRIEYVSKLLGHSDLKTTQIYAKIVNKELDNAMAVFG